MSEAYQMHSPMPALDRPVLIVHLTGWIDASGAAAAALAAVDRGCGGTTLLATFDADRFIDYRARRPTMEIRDGVNSRLVWSQIELRHGTDAHGRNVVLLTGPEPDMQWRAFGDAVRDLAERLGVDRAVCLGAYPFATPHTRPTQVSCTSPSAELIAALPYDKGSVDVPAGMSSVLEHVLTSDGIPTVGLWARVPHYISAMGYPAASVALLEGLHAVSGVHAPMADLERDAAQQRRRIDQLISGNDDHEAMVRQLEGLYDNALAQAPSSSGDLPVEPPDTDQLMAELERFLRDQEQ
jgi:hypothetical protein